MRYLNILCFLAIFSLIGCYDDKGNYDYSELNEISLLPDAQDGLYAIARYDTLRISPELSFRF